VNAGSSFIDVTTDPADALSDNGAFEVVRPRLRDDRESEKSEED
jgi:hypothetical protein